MSEVVELEPPLPFEFVVRGYAISHQATGASKAAWIKIVKNTALANLPVGHFALQQNLHVTIYLFPQGRLTGDIDNRVKPILDAMNSCVYSDDHQVSRLVVQKFEPGEYAFVNPSATLLEALNATEPVVYIRISDDLYGSIEP